MLNHVIVAFLLISGAIPPTFAQSAPARRSTVTAITPAPADRARQWLVLVDDKNYVQSWNDAAKAFRNRQTADAWASDATIRRAPLGAVASRGLKSIDVSRANVAVIHYDTAFARKAAAVETVKLAFGNGNWSVTDYSIN
jgi:hypothetical protein